MNSLKYFGIVGLLAAAGCAAPTNPRAMPPPEKYKLGGKPVPVEAKVEFTPKADILFVIDNSKSMAKHQERLKANIDRFVKRFEENKQLDFHIGVVSVFDSRRYGTPEVPSFYPLGKLYPLKDPAQVNKAVPGPAFVKREEGYTAVLGETLKIGVIPRYKEDENGKIIYDKATGKPFDGGGPEYEEAFSPIVAALDGRNPGFLRKEAQLAVIIITDADDMTDNPDAMNISPSKLADHLVRLKGGDRSKVTTFGVLAIPYMKNGSKVACEPDPGLLDSKTKEVLNPVRIQEFLNATNGSYFSLCAPNYGDELEKVGRVIEYQASQPVRIRLTRIPESCVSERGEPVKGCKPLRVYFKVPGKSVSESPDVPVWTYDAQDYSIVIPREALENAPSNSIGYEFVEVDTRRVGTPRVLKRSSLGR